MPPRLTLLAATPPRTAATVLGEIREALGDLDLAGASVMACEPDAGDRYAEADQRIDALRDEFDARVQSALGLSVEDLRAAYEGALI